MKAHEPEDLYEWVSHQLPEADFARLKVELESLAITPNIWSGLVNESRLIEVGVSPEFQNHLQTQWKTDFPEFLNVRLQRESVDLSSYEQIFRDDFQPRLQVRSGVSPFQATKDLLEEALQSDDSHEWEGPFYIRRLIERISEARGEDIKPAVSGLLPASMDLARSP